MATNTKDLNIKMVVDHSQVDAATKSVDQLDQATKKVENTTKDFGKGVKIVYDSTGKAIDVVTDSSQRLNRQNSALVNSMANLTAQGKQNTAEFTLLQRKHLELTSTIEKTKGASKDLFGTFSMLPGEVGKFAGELQVGVELTKVFSNLTLTGIKTQFQELGQVVKQAFGFGSAKPAEIQQPQQQVQQDNSSATKEQTEALKEQNKVLEKQHENYTNNAGAVKAYTDEIKAINKVGGEYLNLVKQGNMVVLDSVKGISNLTEEESKKTLQAEKSIKADLEKLNITHETITQSKAFKDAKEGEAIVVDKTTGKIQTATEVQKVLTNQTGFATKASKALTGALTGVGFSAETAAIAVGVLEAALAAIGIGIVITGIIGLWNAFKDLGHYLQNDVAWIQKLIPSIKEWGHAEELAKEQTDNFNDSIKRQNELLQENIHWIDSNTKTAVAEAKIKNATNEELYQIEKKGLEDRKTLITKYLNDALATQKKLAGEDVSKLSNEQQKRRFDELQANADNIKKLSEEESAAKEAIEISALNRKDQRNKEADDKELKNLEISIKRNIESRNTDIKQLEKDLQRKTDIEAYWGHYGNKQKKDLELENSKTSLKARTEDIDTSIQSEIIKQQKLLITAKQGSEAYYTEKKNLAEAEYQKELNAAMTAGDKKANMIEVAENNLQTKLNALADEKKKQKEDYNKQLTDLTVLAIKDEYEKSVALRNNQFNNEKDALQKQLNDKIINQKEYDDKLKQMQTVLNNDLDKLASDKKVKDLTAQKAIDESRIKLLYEGTQQYYDQQRKIEEDNYQLQKEAAKGNATELERIEKEHADTILTIARAERDGKRALLFDHLDTVANIGASLQKIAGKNKEVAIAGIRIEQAVTTAKIIMNDLAAIRKSYDASPLTFGLPWSAVYAVDMGLGVVAANTSANDAISALNSADSSGGGGGDTINRGKNYGDGGMINGPSHSSPQGGVPIMAEGGEAVMTRGAVTLFRPLLSMLNQAGGGTAFTGGAMGQAPYDAPESNKSIMETPIVKTYIVENELTTMQERQARLKSLSTL